MAAYPPEDVRAHFKAMVDGLAVARPREPGQSVRFAPPERWHLTVAFIGAVGDPRRAEKALAELGDVEAPTVRIAGGKTLGRGRFTHLVASVKGARTDALGDAVRRALRRNRLPFDERPWQPHVTIARPGDRMGRDEVVADLAVLDGYEGPPWRVDEVRLMQSFLGPTPEYEVLAAVALAGQA
jgi:2'-5' RNA ligase